MLWFLAILGFAASTLADDSGMASNPGQPPASCGNLEPAPVNAAPANGPVHTWEDWQPASAAASSAAASSAASSTTSTVTTPTTPTPQWTTTVSTTLVPQFVPTTPGAPVVAVISPSKLPATTPSIAPEPTSPAPSEVFWGMGTRYDGCTEEDCWQGGACSFVDYTLPATVDGSTCVSEEIWNNGAHCGGCISVTYKGKTITVMVCAIYYV
jgi:hypothetical protein